jgi:shikimate kinase
MSFNKVYLTGFMSSGKSTLGPILANVLGWQFFDLDREIEKVESKTVVEIFKAEGEEYFRLKETEILSQISKTENSIIALGGGTILRDENIKIMKSSGWLVYLKVEPENIYHRLKNKIDRPLFRDLVLGEGSKEEFLEKINNFLENRIHFYEQADITINTDDTRIGVTIDKLKHKILRKINEKN